MIALDSSSFIAYLSGAKGADVDAVGFALEHKQAVLPPIVLTELLCDPKLAQNIIHLFKQLPLLPLTENYWERVGMLRSKLLVKGYKARLADALISQSCLDHGVPLITRDADFRHFVRFGGLKLFI